MLRARAAGWRAYEALLAPGRDLELLAATATSVFARVGGTLVWAGPDQAALHPRAVLLDSPLPGTVSELARLSVDHLTPWRPRGPASVDGARVTAGARALLERLGDLGTPLGFGVLLTGRPPTFPLDAARSLVASLADACTAGSAEEARVAACPLIGLGPGLTPSGDDLVGAVFFSRTVLASNAEDGRRWSDAGRTLVAEASAATHPISAVLLGDLVGGQAHAPLHDLAGALVAAGDGDVLAAAKRVVAIGHSSGWDMLTGLVIGLLGADALVP